MGLSTVNAFKHVKAGVALTDEQFALLQSRLKEMLTDFDTCCKKHHIPYFAGGGTALGAYRHKGFIPWDDDIDLCISRKDYRRFVEVFSAEMGGKYWLHTPQNRADLGLLMARIRMKGTSVRTRDDFFNPDECGAYIDLTIVENTYDNKLMRTVHGVVSMGLMLCVSCRRFRRDKAQYLALTDDMQLSKTIRLKAAIGTILSFMSVAAWTRLADRWNGICKNDDSKTVSIPVGRLYFFGELYERSLFYPPVTLPFEDVTIECPQDTPGYLEMRYGADYMTPPAQDQKEAHIYLPPFRL